MKTSFIYTLKDPITNEIRYVGKTIYLEYRLKRHCGINLARTRKEKWIESLLVIGLKPVIEIIDEVPLHEWKFWEIYWISQFKTWGFNLTNGDNGGQGGSEGRFVTEETRNKLRKCGYMRRGAKMTEESRIKISKASKYQAENESVENRAIRLENLKRGQELSKPLSEEHKKKISESSKGRIKSKEEIEKISNSLKGHVHSDETKLKISKSNNILFMLKSNNSLSHNDLHKSIFTHTLVSKTEFNLLYC